VGQQVQYQLRILRRRDVGSVEWETQLSFPTFRAEWLPTLSGDDRTERGGETYLVLLERRALFAAHPGRLTIPAASLRCTSEDGSEIARIPPLVLEVAEPPAEGRPPGFAGLIGPVTLSASASPGRIALGGSLRLSVIVQGDTNLWSMPSPRESLAQLADVEVFEQPAQLARDAGRALVLRRYFSFDLVPRKAGVLQLPVLRVPYFDPASGRYAEATAPLPALRVADARARAPAHEDARPGTGAEQRPSRRLWSLLALALVATPLALLAVRWRARRAPRDEVAERLAEARAAAARGDGDAAARAGAQALRLALAEEPAAAPEGGAAALLLALERARFAPGAPAPGIAEVEAAVARLRERPRARRR
jgi:hypothetical protein